MHSPFLGSRKAQFYFVIELRATGERIGTCCAFPQDEEGTFDETHRCYDIGYCIRKTHWRQGYGTEAVRLLMDWAAARGAREMTAEAAKENTALWLRDLRAQMERDGLWEGV